MIDVFTSRRRVVCAAFLAVLAGALVPAGAAGAQRDQRIGSFWVRLEPDVLTGEDRGMALVFPDSQAGQGALMWACDAEGPGLVAGLRMMWRRTGDGPRPVTVRFDAGAAESLTLLGFRGRGVWLVGAADAEGFTRRVRGASRLAVIVPPDSAGEKDTELTYTLAGADSALRRLECGAAPAAARGPADGRGTLERAEETPWVHPNGQLSDAPPEELPRFRNASDVVRYLTANYPRQLRDAGVEGEVEVRFRVLEDGRVERESVQVMRSTHAAFEPVAIQAALRARFTPTRQFGRPVKVWMTVPFNFSIENE